MKKELLEKGFDAAFAAYCDHTVLRAYTKSEAVKEFCEEAKKYKPASVCVNPVHVALVHSLLKDTGIKTATVIGFPLGANKTSVKAFEAAEAVKDGFVGDKILFKHCGASIDSDSKFCSKCGKEQ